MKGISLAQLKTELISEEAKRAALVNQGRRAYRLGIDARNCPLNNLSEQNLWNEGYRLELESFNAMLKRNMGNMH